MLIIVGVTLLLNALFNSVNAGVGNLVAEGDKKRIKCVFGELTSLRIWFASVVCFTIYKLGHSFIVLWVGNEYVLEQPAFILLLIIAFINLTRINDVFLAAYGLYQDTWAPITEAVLNLGLSILLGYYWGIIGVLWCILISLLIIVCGWKPFFLYKYGFKESIREYLIYYLKYIFLIVVSCICVTYILNFFPILSSTSYGKWLFHCFVLISTYSVFSLILFICFDRFSRFYLYRIVSLLKK